MLKLNCRNFWNHCMLKQKRWKSKKPHWSEMNKKKFPKDLALAHFDDFYKTVFQNKWHSIRLALLCQHKYCAIVNNYCDAESIMTNLENQGALNLRRVFEVEQNRIQGHIELGGHTSSLGNIYKMDKKMELLFLNKQQEEQAQIYPQVDGSSAASRDITSSESSPEQSSQEDLIQRSMASLKSSLDGAQFDEHRIIDPIGGLSSAALFEFIPATKLKGMEDYVPESQHYGYYKEGDCPVKVTEERELAFPDHLHVYTFEQGNISSFPSPKRGITGVFNYYLLDGASVLPVLALELKPGDVVLDMCSAPGGKALMMLQTLYLKKLVCNDVQESRTTRIHSVLQQYITDVKKKSNEIKVTHGDGRRIEEINMYDKVLVDVPCTTDRHSIHENDNNIFKPTRIKERLKLPETQSQLLSNALKLVRVGGVVVYSTCSLSPIQNDGVVHMALKKIWEETRIEVEIRNMDSALAKVQSIYRIGGKDVGLRYGNIVLPFLPSNFGPMYFCKIVRTK